MKFHITIRLPSSRFPQLYILILLFQRSSLQIHKLLHIYHIKVERTFLTNMPPITDIKHRSHPAHDLKLSHPATPYICDGCKEIGYGICYRCRECRFYLHKECAIPHSPTYHHLFKGSKFDFYRRSPTSGGRICDACGKDVNGFLYHCSSTGYDMHPNCAKLPLILNGEGLTLELKGKASACQKCRVSGRRSNGWSYVSSCGKYCLHVACVKEMIIEAWEKKYFNQQKGHEINRNHLKLPSKESKNGRVITRGRGRSSSPGRRDRRTEKEGKRRYSSCGRSSNNRENITGRNAGRNPSMILLNTGVTVLGILLSAFLGVPITPLASAAVFLAKNLF